MDTTIRHDDEPAEKSYIIINRDDVSVLSIDNNLMPEFMTR